MRESADFLHLFIDKSSFAVYSSYYPDLLDVITICYEKGWSWAGGESEFNDELMRHLKDYIDEEGLAHILVNKDYRLQMGGGRGYDSPISYGDFIDYCSVNDIPGALQDIELIL